MNRAERYRARRERNLRLHAERGPIRPGDVALTVALLVGAALVLPVVTTLGGVAAMSSDTCGPGGCTGFVGAAVVVGLFVPVAIFLIGAVVGVVRLFRHLRGWPFALGVIVAEVVCLPLAWGLVGLGAALA